MDILELKGCVGTIVAMGRQTAIAEKIIQKQTDSIYFMLNLLVYQTTADQSLLTSFSGLASPKYDIKSDTNSPKAIKQIIGIEPKAMGIVAKSENTPKAISNGALMQYIPKPIAAAMGNIINRSSNVCTKASSSLSLYLLEKNIEFTSSLALALEYFNEKQSIENLTGMVGTKKAALVYLNVNFSDFII